MNPRRFMPFVGLCVLSMASGCGTIHYADSGQYVDSARIEAFAVDAEPVADVASAQLFLPKFFMGLGVGQVWVPDSSLVTSTVLDMNFALDMFTWATLEVTFGFWNIADRPGNIPSGDSHLTMMPTIASLQFYRDIPKWKSRYYLAAGAGYSDNDYNLGSNHHDHVVSADSLTTFDVIVSDGPVMRGAFGWEFYSSADAKLNLTIEASYVKGQATLEVERNGDIYEVGDFPMHDIWMLRTNITWHF